jgi:hypothetical protein
MPPGKTDRGIILRLTSSDHLPFTMFAFSSSAPLVVPIGYSIVNSSEHSGKYTAENIRVDNPNDQASRWSGASGAQPIQNLKQWILLRLDSVCVLS